MPFVKLAPEELPSDANHFFTDSGFTHQHGSTLPTPEEVRQQAARDGADLSKNFRPDPVRFSALNLIVKWGQDVTIAEGQCLFFLRTRLGDHVPVPEVYGWRTDGEEVFLYMELVDGEPLADVWPNLSEEDKSTVSEQLRCMIACWRGIERDDSSNGLCQIGGQALRDIHFSDARRPGCYPAGPFPDLATFHDFFARLSVSESSNDSNVRVETEELSGLDDDIPLVFTHGDLDLSNILVTKPENRSAKVIAIIDWHQSGWYPAPWEWLKAQCVAVQGSDWVDTYLPTILPTVPFEYFYAWEYVSMSTI